MEFLQFQEEDKKVKLPYSEELQLILASLWHMQNVKPPINSSKKNELICQKRI